MLSILLSRFKAKLPVLGIAVGLSLSAPASFSADFASHEIKAVFLFNFANFVHWPDEAFAEESSPFIFCASNAQSPTIKTLSEVIQGESLNRHKLIIKAPFNPAELSSCHVLFLEETDITEYQSHLPVLSAGTVLTVSDTRRFVSSGGLIELVQNKNRIQPTINTDQLEKSQLKISSTLLRLAKIYRPPTTGGTP